MAYFEEFPHARDYDKDLGWLIQEMRKIIQNVADQNDKIEAVEELAAELKTFVNNYFDDLDVQEEINSKIDQMVRDGTFYSLFDDLISEVIDTWLDEYITPTSPPLDASFTLENAAAQAKAVGDKCYVDRRIPSEGVDLNDLTPSGGYRITNAVAASAANCPQTTAGNLLVFNSNDVVTQIYHSYSNTLQIRYKSSSSWTAWKNLEPINQVVSEGIDFNDLKTTAYYRITNNAASNCQNIPANEGGALMVYSIGQGTVQYYMNTSGQLYWRYATTGGAWTVWRYSDQLRTDGPLTNTLPVGLYAKNRTVIQAHQGYKRIAPANSWIAYDLAGRHGFDAVQIAVARRSHDGTWYVMHDEDVSITTGGTGNIKDLTDSYIDSLSVIVGNNVDLYTATERRVPKLEEVLDICRKYGMIASIRLGAIPNGDATAENLEIINSFINCVNKYNPQTIIFSGNENQVFQIKKRIKNAAIQVYYPNATVENVNAYIALCRKEVYNNASFLGPTSLITNDMIKQLHAAGIIICAYTPTDPTMTEVATLLTSGADIIQESEYSYNDVIS